MKARKNKELDPDYSIGISIEKYRWEFLRRNEEYIETYSQQRIVINPLAYNLNISLILRKAHNQFPEGLPDPNLTYEQLPQEIKGNLFSRAPFAVDISSGKPLITINKIWPQDIGHYYYPVRAITYSYLKERMLSLLSPPTIDEFKKIIKKIKKRDGGGSPNPVRHFTSENIQEGIMEIWDDELRRSLVDIDWRCFFLVFLNRLLSDYRWGGTLLLGLSCRGVNIKDITKQLISRCLRSNKEPNLPFDTWDLSSDEFSYHIRSEDWERNGPGLFWSILAGLLSPWGYADTVYLGINRKGIKKGVNWEVKKIIDQYKQNSDGSTLLPDVWESYYQVWDLYRLGRKDGQIAKKLGMERGAVEKQRKRAYKLIHGREYDPEDLFLIKPKVRIKHLSRGCETRNESDPDIIEAICSRSAACVRRWDKRIKKDLSIWGRFGKNTRRWAKETNKYNPCENFKNNPCLYVTPFANENAKTSLNILTLSTIGNWVMGGDHYRAVGEWGYSEESEQEKIYAQPARNEQGNPVFDDRKGEDIIERERKEEKERWDLETGKKWAMRRTLLSRSDQKRIFYPITSNELGPEIHTNAEDAFKGAVKIWIRATEEKGGVLTSINFEALKGRGTGEKSHNPYKIGADPTLVIYSMYGDIIKFAKSTGELPLLYSCYMIEDDKEREEYWEKLNPSKKKALERAIFEFEKKLYNAKPKIIKVPPKPIGTVSSHTKSGGDELSNRFVDWEYSTLSCLGCRREIATISGMTTQSWYRFPLKHLFNDFGKDLCGCGRTLYPLKGILDGKTYVGKYGEKEKEASEDVELEFKDGRLYPSVCSDWNVEYGEYGVKLSDWGETINFEAKTFSIKHGEIVWRGTARNDSMSVRFTRTKKITPSIVTLMEDKWFEGTLKNEKGNT